MHVDCNLDDFEYEEKSREVKVPYIISIDEGSERYFHQKLRYGRSIDERKDYFVHFKFLPGLGFYGFGLTI